MSASDGSSLSHDHGVWRLLERLGIRRDGLMIVHSAFKTMAGEGHDLKTVLETLVDYMSPGTLLLPTMSWWYVKPASPVFDELRTPSNTGALTELFRTHYAAARSLHPTHSVSGCGPLAAEILGSHHLDDTPCSPRSPWGLLAPHDAWVLMFGVTIDYCTLIHHVEEMVAPDLYLRPTAERETYICRDRHGRETTVHVRRHFRLLRDFFQFQDMLAVQGQLRVGRVDNSICRAFRARDLVRVATETLDRRPDAIIARVGQRYRRM